MDEFVEEKVKRGLERLGVVVEEDVRYTNTKVVEKSKDIVGRLAGLYLGYVEAANRLSLAGPLALHPDKAAWLRALLEATLGRIIELKHEMVSLDCSDYQYFNTHIIAAGISRRQACLRVPGYFRHERREVVAELQARLRTVLEEKAERERREAEEKAEKERREAEGRSSVPPEPRPSQEEQPEEPEQQEEVAVVRPKFESEVVFPFLEEVLLVQRHERARVSRLYVQAERERLRVERDKAYQVYQPIPEQLLDWAVGVIQRAWRRYREWRRERYRITQNRLLYGTLTPSYRPSCSVDHLAEQREAARRERELRKAEAVQVLAKEIEINETADIKDDMLEEMRDWIKKFYDCTKEFGYTELPQWPNDACLPPKLLPYGIPEGLGKEYIKTNFTEVKCELEGCVLPPLCGSELISAGHWIEQEKYPPAAFEVFKKGAVKEPAVDPERLKEEKEEKAREEAEMIAELKRIGHIPWKSSFLPELKLYYKDYITEFSPGRDLNLNPDQEFELERAKEDIIYDIRRRLRPKVDAQIREELRILQKAVDEDEAEERAKMKGGPRPVPKMKKAKPEKKKKKKKKRGKKDPLGRVLVETLFTELVEDGLLVEREEVSMESLEGVFTQHGQGTRVKPLPGRGDVLEMANLYVTLPLCCQDIKDRTQPIKSVLLVGPSCCTWPIVQAIATAAGAILFHIPTVNMASRYSDKMLIGALLKVAKAYQPAIFWADQLQKGFYRKIPVEEKELNLSGARRVLPKLLKALRPADRAVVIGCSEEPWLAKPAMVSLFDKVLPIPEDDLHQCASDLQRAVMKYHGVDREFNTMLPAAAYLGQSPEDMVSRIDQTFTFERIVSLRQRPLELLEIGCLEKEQPQLGKVKAWFNANYNLVKKRAAMIYEMENPRKKGP